MFSFFGGERLMKWGGLYVCVYTCKCVVKIFLCVVTFTYFQLVNDLVILFHWSVKFSVVNFLYGGGGSMLPFQDPVQGGLQNKNIKYQILKDIN